MGIVARFDRGVGVWLLGKEGCAVEHPGSAGVPCGEASSASALGSSWVGGVGACGQCAAAAGLTQLPKCRQFNLPAPPKNINVPRKISSRTTRTEEQRPHHTDPGSSHISAYFFLPRHVWKGWRPWRSGWSWPGRRRRRRFEEHRTKQRSMEQRPQHRH